MNIVCADGRDIEATLHRHENDACRGLLIVNSATGITQDFYQPFAAYMGRTGFDVLTWDGRAIGKSVRGHAKADPARMRDWGALDFEAVLRHANRHLGYPWQDITVLGHSSGGHLAGLAPSIIHVPRLVLVASGTCAWRLYPVAQWPRILGAWWFAAPIMQIVFGFLPARLGVGHDLPRGVVKDWRAWSLSRDYLFSDASLDTAGYRAYCGQVFSLSFSDDIGFSPPATVADLLRHFPNAQKEHLEIDAGAPMVRGTLARGIGHFGFFKADRASLWPLADRWKPVARVATGQATG